jgi:large subunit ribosomal protein L24
MKSKIRSGDLVQVMVGDDASKEPKKVKEIVADGRKVVVEGVHRVYKHVRKGHPKSPGGGRISLELPIDISKVLLWCEKCARGVRVGFKYEADGSKFRVCKKCDGDLGRVSPPRAAYAKKG